MWAKEFFDHKAWLNDKGIIFSFTGYLSEGVLFALGDALRKKMAIEDADTNVAKRVFSVFVEQTQNIIRYSEERLVFEGTEPPTQDPVELSSGVVTVGFQGGAFEVVCGNIISAKSVETLKERLDHLAKMDKDEIKKFYRAKLREPSEEDSKGGSIGLIEIARRSTQPIEYDFVWTGEDQAFFCLKSVV